MKRIICIILVVLLLPGCRMVGNETVSATEPAAIPRESAQLPETAVPGNPERDSSSGAVPEGKLPFANAGKARIPYTGNASWVRYITAVEELPREGTWDGYDAAYFETGALLVVVETVGSGSVRLELDSILIEGDTAFITINRTMSGDVGTADMATWLLWAEVEKGLNCTWTLENVPQTPVNDKY